MTQDKAHFIQWIKRHGLFEVVMNFHNLPIVEIKPTTNGKINKNTYGGALDPRYIMCISGKPETMTDGGLTEGYELAKRLTPDTTLLIFFVPTRKDALNILARPQVDLIRRNTKLGTGTLAPTSINAFKAWCMRNGVNLKLCQRMASFDPASINIKAIQRDYYWCEFEVSDLLSELQLSNVPHKFEMREGIKTAIVLAKAGGQYKPKKQLLIEKALTAAQLNRDEKSARFYAELFLQQPVANVNISNINWNAPDLGMQLVNAAVTKTNVTVKEETNDTGDTSVPAVTPFDF